MLRQWLPVGESARWTAQGKSRVLGLRRSRSAVPVTSRGFQERSYALPMLRHCQLWTSVTSVSRASPDRVGSGHV